MARSGRMTRSRNRIWLLAFWASLSGFVGMMIWGAPGGLLLKTALYALSGIGLFFGVMSGILPWAATRLIRRLDMKNDPRYAEAYELLRDAELTEG